jgi:hypothetical protein
LSPGYFWLGTSAITPIFRREIASAPVLISLLLQVELLGATLLMI